MRTRSTMLRLPWALGALFMLVTMSMADASSNLYVVAPNIMRVNTDEEVWVTQHNTQNTPATVKLHLEDYPLKGSTFSHRTITVNKDESKSIAMRVGWGDIPHGSAQTYVILVAECTALGFRKESIILLSKNSGYLFAQTDKPIYQPHQKVRVQIVSLGSDMKPSNLKFNVDIMDPKGDLVKRYRDRIADNGFVKETYELPNILVYGNWTVVASYQDSAQPEAKKTAIQFEVKEYVLPTFSVNVKFLNEYILSNSADVQFKIITNYVFGTPVTGKAKVYFILVAPDGTELDVGHRKIDVTGDDTASITKQEFGNKWFPPEGTRLLVKVTVTEGATGKQESGQASSAVFVKSPYLISFDRMPKSFRPGLPFTVKVDATYPNKNSASNIPISITALVTVGGREEGAHGNKVRVKDYFLDENGRKDVTLDPPAGATTLKLTVATRPTPDLIAAFQRSKEINLSPHTSQSGEYMTVMLRSVGNRITVNNNVEVRVDFSNTASKKVNFLIVARGKILRSFVKTVSGRTTHENIAITPLMPPQARVIAYYSASRGDVVSDSMVMEIIKSCGSELTITAGVTTDFRPKDKVTLTVNAGKGSTVSVLGVDKAVYLLSEKDILTRSKMFKKMVEMDIGCGPGGGTNTIDVFEKAGLSILLKTGSVANPMRQSEGCAQKTSRVKRDLMKTVQDIRNRLTRPDRTCCNHGARDSVDGASSCIDLARAYGQGKTLTCTNAYKQCCEAERRSASMARGRSGGDDGGGLQSGVFGAEVTIDRREDFRETWINELLTFGQNEASQDIKTALPDSITTWVISGVSVSPTQGMCVAVPSNITSTKPFFVHVDLPYAAVRTEQLEVRATVYNLGSRKLNRVDVMLKADDDICYAAEAGQYTYRQTISLEPRSAKSVLFPIAPITGLKGNRMERPAEIFVKALTSMDGDEVIKKLYIKNEGIRKSKTWSITLDPEGKMNDAGSGKSDMDVDTDKQAKRQTIRIQLKFPADTIPGTEVCSLSIHGNLLGNMVPTGDFDLSKRFKLPKGCAEQNMMTMAPLIYAMTYLLNTGKLTGPLEANGYDHITKGYESELAYKKNDGSFGAWKHYPSSSWLTAFIAKVFCQASKFDQIGQKVRQHIIDAVNWLFRNAQDRSGKFFETHVVIHKEMLGNSVLNDITLTSFIVECIASCKAVINLSSREFAHPLRKAVQYLERNRQTQLGNPYGQAILTYALTMVDSPKKLEANQRLVQDMSNFDRVTGMRYWSLDGQAPNHNTPSWYTKPAPAVAIETASYALLTQLALGTQASSNYFQTSGEIAAWLIQQRTKSGSFSSTADTVLGLQALAEYASAASSRSTLDMRVHLYASGADFGANENIELKEATALIPILIEQNLPIGDTLSVEATGQGMAQFQVECAYNAPPKDDENCPFNLEVDATDYKAKEGELGDLDDEPPDDEDDRSRFGRSANQGKGTGVVTRIKSKIRYNGVQVVGMSILEVSLFTGFRPKLEDLKKLKTDGTVDEYEITGSSVIFYLKEISNIEDTLVVFRAIQDVQVGKTQPVAVKVYDYYEPNSRKCTKFYHPKASSPLLAQTCENSKGRKVCDCVAGTCAEYWGFDRRYLPRGKRAKLKTRTVLFQEACSDYDYVVKVKAGQTLVNAPLKEMFGTIEHVIKLGSDNLDTGEQMHFVWNSDCAFPVMNADDSYLVMGMDGTPYTGRDGRSKMKYVLDKSTHVVNWPDAATRPLYSAALTFFANKMVRDGCNQ